MLAIVEPVFSTEQALPVRLWKENIHGPVTLRQMLEFYARDFFLALETLHTMKGEVLSMRGEALPQGRFQVILGNLSTLDGHLKNIGLIHSCDQMDRISTLLKTQRVDANHFATLITSLQERIDDELCHRVFFGIEQELTTKFFYCPDPNLFRLESKPLAEIYGKEVMMKLFQADEHDPKEAVRCLVCGRATAAVFHLMRMLEIGLTPLAAIFAVSMAHTNWGPALELLESKIKHMHTDPVWKLLSDCKDRQEQYGQAASHFDMLRVAWRNYTAHARGKYTSEEAEDIFRNVKGFLGKVADLLVRYPAPPATIPAIAGATITP